MANRPPAEGTAAESDWLTAFYAEYRSRLQNFVVGIVHNRETASDIVQTVFAEAVRAADELRPEAAKNWLYKAAFHEAITWKRRAEVERRAAGRLQERHGTEDSYHCDESSVRKETVELVLDAIRGLPLKQQQVLRARIYDDKTYAQIASETGAPLGTVLTHMRRALEKLRQKLKRIN